MELKPKIKYEKFVSVINELHKLKNELIYKPQENNLNIKKFTDVINDLKNLKNIDGIVLNQRVKIIQELISSNPHKLKISTFELMEYNFNENTHSNILEYIFDYNLIGNTDILSEFILKTDIANLEKIQKIINLKNYYIEREKSVNYKNKNGRIDLFIYDDKNKMVIVIENKIYAGINSRNDEDEEGEPKTQLDLYENYINTKFKEYEKVFILLSYREITQDYPPYAIVKYDDLYEILKKVEIEDNVLNEYKMLLHSLNNNIENKMELIRQTKNLNNTANINLNTLEQLTGLLNEE